MPSAVARRPAATVARRAAIAGAAYAGRYPVSTARALVRGAKLAWNAGSKARSAWRGTKQAAKRASMTHKTQMKSFSKPKFKAKKCKTLTCKVNKLEKAVANLQGRIKLRYINSFTMFNNPNKVEYFGSNTFDDLNAGGIAAGAPPLVNLNVMSRLQLGLYLHELRFYNTTTNQFDRKDIKLIPGADISVSLRNFYSKLDLFNPRVTEVRVTCYLMKAATRTDRGVYITAFDAMEDGYEKAAGAGVPVSIRDPLIYITDPALLPSIQHTWKLEKTYKCTLGPGSRYTCSVSVPDFELDMSSYNENAEQFSPDFHTYCWFLRVEGPFGSTSLEDSGTVLAKTLDVPNYGTGNIVAGIHSWGGELVYNTGGPDFRKTIISNELGNIALGDNARTQVRDTAQTLGMAIHPVNTTAT